MNNECIERWCTSDELDPFTLQTFETCRLPTYRKSEYCKKHYLKHRQKEIEKKFHKLKNNLNNAFDNIGRMVCFDGKINSHAVKVQKDIANKIKNEISKLEIIYKKNWDILWKLK